MLWIILARADERLHVFEIKPIDRPLVKISLVWFRSSIRRTIDKVDSHCRQYAWMEGYHYHVLYT